MIVAESEILPKVKVYIGSPLMDAEPGMARLNEATMKALGVKEGDVIEVSHGIIAKRNLTFKVLKAYPEDDHSNVIRISEADFKRAGFRLDAKCSVSTT